MFSYEAIVEECTISGQPLGESHCGTGAARSAKEARMADFGDLATGYAADLEAAFLELRKRSSGTFLAVALAEGGEFVVRSGDTAASALIELPEEHALWLVAELKGGVWRVDRHQFPCLSNEALLQLAKWAGDNWLREVNACMSRHPDSR